jgi:hypothetical protein
MKSFLLICMLIAGTILSVNANIRQSKDHCLDELIEKTTQAHRNNPCSGGEHLLFIDYFSYRQSTLFLLVFDKNRPCPDFINQTIYYDSLCRPAITILDGGLKYHHRVSPEEADLKQLALRTRVTAKPINDAEGRKIPLEDGGRRLRDFYFSLDVENLWIAGQHINWENGIADKPDATSGNHTHCSAFVAAACKRLNIYILRPPEHKQVLLANAQFEWLKSNNAVSEGWKPLTGGDPYETAQRLANRGLVVIAICENPDPSKPGHIALIMPAELTREEMEESGPACIMAGRHNFNKISLKNGFKSHLTAWPERSILFYYNSKIPG